MGALFFGMLTLGAVTFGIGVGVVRRTGVVVGGRAVGVGGRMVLPDATAARGLAVEGRDLVVRLVGLTIIVSFGVWTFTR